MPTSLGYLPAIRYPDNATLDFAPLGRAIDNVRSGMEQRRQRTALDALLASGEQSGSIEPYQSLVARALRPDQGVGYAADAHDKSRAEKSRAVAAERDAALKMKLAGMRGRGTTATGDAGMTEQQKHRADLERKRYELDRERFERESASPRGPEFKEYEIGGDVVRIWTDGRSETMYTKPRSTTGAEPLVGGPTLPKRPAAVVTKPPAAARLTESERSSATYALMMEDAERAAALSTYDPTSTAAALLPSTMFDSDEYRAYQQTLNQWVRAKLRDESGASIAVEEMENEITTFFPRPGDGPLTIARKKAAREQALKALRIQAGAAYVEPSAEPAPRDGETSVARPTSKAEISALPVGTHFKWEGATYVVDTDGTLDRVE